MNEEAIWHRCHSNMHRPNNKSDSSTRKRSVGLSYENIQINSSGYAQHEYQRVKLQHPQSHLDVANYSNMYNGNAVRKNLITSQSFGNDRKNCNDAFTKPADRGTFKDYCDHCTIHGLKYVGDTTLPKFERSFWMLSVVLALCGAAFFIWHLYFKFTTTPIIISRSSVSVTIDQIPFPALTICNMNNAKKTVADEISRGTLFRGDELQQFLLDDICDRKSDAGLVSESVKKEASKSGYFLDFLRKASQSCSDMLYFCKWNSNVTNCTDLFNPVYTDEGLCCNFNSVKRILRKGRKWDGLDISWASDKHVDWNPEYMFKKTDPAMAIPWRGRGSGVSHGLTLALDVDIGEYYCSSTASVGFKMLLHSPVESPQISDYGFTLSPGKETRVIITPHITDADSAITKIAPKIRQCYFLHEKKLRYYRTYTQRNCQRECETNFTLQLCGCVQYYMPAEASTKLCGKAEDQCTTFAKKVMNDKLDDDEENHNIYNYTVLSCKCYPGCFEINYSTEISQSMLVATFEVEDEFFKNNPAYYEKNIAIVHLFYVDTSYMKYTKNELYGFAELLSNTGGLLGLFMGFSLLSVTEMLYYVMLRIRTSFHRNRKADNAKLQVVPAFTKRRAVTYPFTQ
ncbi:pickpocket protein 28-like [Phymastichus coffea]|uniref:pickpocket protein 28-like n=1 Tax=Phymastichus coffea TaxID=108790 RepID=UPI00273CE0CD|nr:pickpocket protein 28-like [Phymastichus coffea]